MYETCLQHARADRALRGIVADELEGFKVTMMEWLLLGVVCSGSDKGQSMSSIAKTLDVTLPQVTALVTNLVKHKLVKQKTQAQDRRSRHVVPTNKGRLLLTDMEDAINVSMKRWLSDIPQENLKIYLKTVKALAAQND